MAHIVLYSIVENIIYSRLDYSTEVIFGEMKKAIFCILTLVLFIEIFSTC